MDDAEKYVVANMLRMRPSKKLLYAELIKDTGKYIMLKDVHGIQTKIAPTSVEDILLAEMKNIPGNNDGNAMFSL